MTAVARVLLVELLAPRLELGDVRLVVLGDVRDHHPVAGEVRRGDLLDPGPRATRSTGPNFSKSIEGHGGRSRPNPGPAGAAGAGPLSANSSHVLARDPALAAGAAHLRELDAELPRGPPGAGAGIDGRSRPAPGPPRGPGALAAAVGARAADGVRPGTRRASAEALGAGALTSAESGRIGQQQRALRDRGRRPSPELPDHAGERRGHVHRRLVGLERQQRIVDAPPGRRAKRGSR